MSTLPNSPMAVANIAWTSDSFETSALTVIARRPQIDGPVTVGRFICPSSRFDVVAPRFDAKASFNESFTSVDGWGRMAIASISTGNNGLAAFTGELTYKGSFADVGGRVKLAAQNSRLGTIFADRTRLAGAYRLGTRAGTFGLVGDFAADAQQNAAATSATAAPGSTSAEGNPCGDGESSQRPPSTSPAAPSGDGAGARAAGTASARRPSSGKLRR